MKQLFTLVFVGAVAIGCHHSPPTPTPVEQVVPIVIPGLQNTFRVSGTVYSGSSPEGANAFQALKTLGVKTIISVDGAVPEVHVAEEWGIRYVHIPVGYDGISREKQIMLASTITQCEGPFYIHCHHGKHRGPTAVAYIQLCSNPNWTITRAEEWLKNAGTDPAYRGLYQVVQGFTRPSEEELAQAPKVFPSEVGGHSLLQRMVQMDKHWAMLQAVQKNDWAGDKSPAEVALLLTEEYREAARTEVGAKKRKEFLHLLQLGETQGQQLQEALAKNNADSIKSAMTALATNCKTCHAQYRDRPQD